MVKPNTDTLWTKQDPTDLYIAMQTLCRASDGSFMFGGAARHPTIGSTHGTYLRKLNSHGQLLWNKTDFFNNTGGNVIMAALSLPDKSYLVGGSINDKHYSISRADSLGNFTWSKNYNRSQYFSLFRTMQFTATGNVITAGNSSPVAGIYHIRMLLLNQNGDSLLGKQIVVTGPNRLESMYDGFNGVLPLSDGGYLLTARTDTILNPPYRQYLGMAVRLDANMNVIWKYVHRNQNTEEYVFSKAKELTDGSILVLGFQ
ncbi:MAG TPA: hypothetical protein VK927_05995, partial [Adhaeribacter sp.]|nr:hypothetical protein [Adhaeribacter sp.]